ncbi:MAG: CinA family protein [Candidatus Thermoplasmatota archaeon]|nr:CinA family protein [Candidatus Thermoplasmatota archaeon]
MENIASLLKKRNLKIATAESCTGGLIGHTITNVPGSSYYYEGGVISYSNAIKMKFLGVNEETLKKYGAVSEQTAKEMAEGIKNRASVNIGIATTGIAGPGGGTTEKPVGLVYVALAGNEGTYVKKFNFHGNRGENKKSTCDAAINMLLNYLEQYD